MNSGELILFYILVVSGMMRYEAYGNFHFNSPQRCIEKGDECTSKPFQCGFFNVLWVTCDVT